MTRRGRQLAVTVALRVGRGRRLAALVAAALVGLAGGSGYAWQRLGHQVRLLTPVPTRLFVDTQGRFLAEVSQSQRRLGYWQLPPRIPPRVEAATLAAEDARFYRHPGVDWRSVLRAAWQDLRAGHVVSGASTLAMQVAKMQHPRPRTLLRKAAEAVVALRLTHRFGHRAVLRQYLTLAPYGNRARGIVYAARRYFDKPVADLSWAEAAFLAGLPKMPGRLNVHHRAGRARAEVRARYVLGRLEALGWMSKEAYAEAEAALPRLLLAPHQVRPVSAIHAVLAMDRQLDRRGAPAGHRVRTTLDLDVQRTVARAVAAQVKTLRNRGAGNLAVVVADARTGAIRAYLGSADYLDRWHHGAIDYARVARSSGSSLKPFIYALGMSRAGFTAATVLDDVGLAPDASTGSYTVRNYDGTFLGPVLYRNALANSRNIPAVEVLRAVGVDPAYRTFYELGLVRRWRDPSRYGLGMAIGAMPVRLVDLVGAYGALANGGRRTRLSFFPGSRPGRRVLPEDVSRAITGFLSDPMARLPSFRRGDALDLPFPVAVKTGTSQGFRDAWCVGFSRRWLVGVWVGRADDGPMAHVSGASGAGKVFHAVMAALQPAAMQGLSDTGFPPPRGWVSRRVDMLTGKLAGPLAPYVAVAWFKPGTEPVTVTDAYRQIVVDRRTGRPAAPGTPRRWRRRRTFVDLGPRFAAWAKAAGLRLPPLPALPGDPRHPDVDPRIVLDAPARGARVLADPDLPAADATLRLSARVTPPVPQVVWWVDGRPYKVVDYPYETRWPLTPGRHVFQVRLPYAPVRSATVAVRVDG